LNAVKVICINVLIFLFIIELVLHFWGLNYLREITVGVVDEGRRKDLEFLFEKTEFLAGASFKIPHPFFAYGHPNEDHNLRFETNENYRVVGGDENVVAFFGGSVADNVYNLLKMNDKSYLSSKLGLPVSRAINFAMSGSRQPQQMSIANIYAHSYNIAINIEGRNEMAGGDMNYPPYFPHQMAAMSTYFGRTENLIAIGKLRELIGDYITIRNTAQKSQNSIIKIHQAYYVYREKMIAREVIRFSNSMTALPGRKRFKNKELYSSHSDLKRWLRYSCQQQNIQASFGVRSFFVIQPVPQHKKPLSVQEKEIVEASHYEKRRQAYQPVIDLDLLSLKDTGINLIDATSLFADEVETVYRDSCCHFLADARQRFLEFILAQVRFELDLKMPPKFCNISKLTAALQTQFPTENIW
jgi:hypothetical protein